MDNRPKACLIYMLLESNGIDDRGYELFAGLLVESMGIVEQEKYGAAVIISEMVLQPKRYDNRFVAAYSLM